MQQVCIGRPELKLTNRMTQGRNSRCRRTHLMESKLGLRLVWGIAIPPRSAQLFRSIVRRAWPTEDDGLSRLVDGSSVFRSHWPRRLKQIHRLIGRHCPAEQETLPLVATEQLQGLRL